MRGASAGDGFKAQAPVSGFRAQSAVSGFRFQVSGRRAQVSSFKFGYAELKVQRASAGFRFQV